MDDRDDDLDDAEDADAIRRRESLLSRITLEGPIVVPTRDLRYVPGDYEAWNGVKGGGPRGYGWNSRGIPSQYRVVVIAPGGDVEVRIDRVFKWSIGRLTPKRRDIIKRTMPPTLTLIIGDDPWYGKDQLLVSGEELALWIVRVQETLQVAGKRTRPAS